MIACRLTVGAAAWFLARDVKGADMPDLPVVSRVRRRCRCHRPYRFDVLWSDGRRVNYLPDDRLDVVEVAP